MIYWELKTKDSLTYDSILKLGVRKPYDIIRVLRKKGVDIIIKRNGGKTSYALGPDSPSIVMGYSIAYDNKKVRDFVVKILSDGKSHQGDELRMKAGVPNISHVIHTLRKQGYQIHCDKTEYRKPKYTLHK